MSSINIIKNFLPLTKFKRLQEIVFSHKFPYYYSATVGNYEAKDGFMFTHLLYDIKKITSDFYSDISKPLFEKLNIKKENLVRLKINCYTKSNEHNYHFFHTDWNYKHKVLLYNLNDNNGYTEFENNEKIISKANEAIIFDGNIKHRSVSQTDEDLRININLNYKETI